MSPDDPKAPPQRVATIRQSIMTYLANHSGATAREISAEVGIPEKTVGAHLEHLQKSFKAHRLTLHVIPAVCLECGFAFSKRQRLSRPGKCPLCRSSRLTEPRFLMK